MAWYDSGARSPSSEDDYCHEGDDYTKRDEFLDVHAHDDSTYGSDFERRPTNFGRCGGPQPPWGGSHRHTGTRPFAGGSQSPGLSHDQFTGNNPFHGTTPSGRTNHHCDANRFANTNQGPQRAGRSQRRHDSPRSDNSDGIYGGDDIPTPEPRPTPALNVTNITHIHYPSTIFNVFVHNNAIPSQSGSYHGQDGREFPGYQSHAGSYPNPRIEGCARIEEVTESPPGAAERERTPYIFGSGSDHPLPFTGLEQTDNFHEAHLTDASGPRLLPWPYQNTHVPGHPFGVPWDANETRALANAFIRGHPNEVLQQRFPTRTAGAMQRKIQALKRQGLLRQNVWGRWEYRVRGE